MSIATELELLANTKENLRGSLGIRKDVPFSQYILSTRSYGLREAVLPLVDRHEIFLDKNTGDTDNGEEQMFIQNTDGLLSNNRHFIASTQMEYQPNGDATTEGQSLHVLGYTYMYMVTNDEKYLNKAIFHWDAYHKYFYKSQPIPETPQRWIANWLANSKEPVLANWPINPYQPTCGGYKGMLVNFTNGVAQIPHGAPSFGEYLDVATFAHRGHMRWEAINGGVATIDANIDWQLLWDQYRSTDIGEKPWLSTNWIKWAQYEIDHGVKYNVDWSTDATKHDINTIVTWKGDLIGVGPGSDDQLWSGDVLESNLPNDEIGKITLVDKTINGPYFINYAVRLPVHLGGYEFERNEVWHNRPIHTPLLGGINQMGNAADAEEWFADASYLLWKATGDEKYHRAMQASLYTNLEYTTIDSKDKFFRNSISSTSPHTDGISYEYTYPAGVELRWKRTDKGYIEYKVMEAAQLTLGQQAIWTRINSDSSILTEYGGVDGVGGPVAAKIEVAIGSTKQDANPVRYGTTLPVSESNYVESHVIKLDQLQRMYKPDGGNYILADTSSVAGYGDLTWTKSYETNILGNNSGSVMTAEFANDSGGAIIGMWAQPGSTSPLNNIVYRADADINIRIADEVNILWYWFLPSTNGEWSSFSLSKETLNRSYYQPGAVPGEVLPEEAVYTEIDQLSVLLAAAEVNKTFSYYCINEIPESFSGDDGFIKNYSLTVSSDNAYTAWVGDCYVVNARPDGLTYSPGVVPFSNIYKDGSDQIGPWNGMPYPGYQYPFIYSLEPEKYSSHMNKMVDFLYDAQVYYNQQIGELGPVASAYVWDRWDNYKYGAANQFTMYHWGNGKAWSGYQPRAFQGAARALQELHYRNKPLPVKLVTYVTNWIHWLVTFNEKANGVMPTDFPTNSVSIPDPSDFTAHMTGLWLSGMAMAWEAGIRPDGVMDAMWSCVRELESNISVTNIPGHPMDGAWSPYLDLPGLNGMAFGFHTGEVYRGLAMFAHILSGKGPLYTTSDTDANVNVITEEEIPPLKTSPWITP